VEPAWSPDATQVVFASNRDGPTDLYVATLATGDVTRLTQLGHVGQPTWLHNGRIVFTQWVGGGGASLAWLDPATPTTVNPIVTTGDAQHPAAYP
jgi:Tol biopolymer transport system component